MSLQNIRPSDAVQAIYVDHHGWLLGWLRRQLGGGVEQAADLAHDTFVRLLTAPQERTVLELREPRAYLTTLARRLVIDHRRRLSLENAWLEALALMPEPVAPPPEQRLIILETLHKVDAMLDGLAPKARSAFLLSQLEGLTYAQIAARLAVSERSVKRYMAQAFEQCILLIA